MMWLIAAGMSAQAIEREEVLDIAALNATHAWTMTSDNVYASCSSGYSSSYSAGTYFGLPYDWGGHNTPEDFDDALLDGDGAGSHSWHGVLSCTVGLDCSGFISRTWETGTKYGTATLYQVTSEISLSSLERGDAVNKSGSHVVLWTYETAAGNPIFYEAAGSAERTRVNTGAGWSYLDGYTAIRYDDIETGPTTATTAEPLEIDAFPFVDNRWTAGTASDVIDSYSCSPGTDESGPEVFYRFYAVSGGILTAAVSDDTGVDIDIHVLTEADGDACIARDDSEVSVSIDPGWVWLSLDTYVGSKEYPGPYLLVADFTGEIGDAPDEEEPDGEEPDEEEPDEEEPDEEVEVENDTGLPPGDEIPGAEVAVSQLGDRYRTADSGCGCGSAPLPASVALMLLPTLWVRRRRFSQESR